jgi:hypothetical protein
MNFMKLFKSFLILTLAIGVLSCGSEQKNIETSSLNVDKKESLSQKNVSEKKGEFSNPAIIFGTDFLTFFKSLRKLGKFDDMIKFTSSESIEKYGKSELVKLYQNSFNNMSDSKLLNLESNGEGKYTMYYSNSEFATKRAFDIKVVIENDSTKLVYEKKFPF